MTEIDIKGITASIAVLDRIASESRMTRAEHAQALSAVKLLTEHVQKLTIQSNEKTPAVS